MTQYAVLLTGDEARWEAMSPDDRAAVFARHDAFAQALAERGHAITGGAQLTHSRGAKLVRSTEQGVVVTDGPYSEAVEQLGGFYLVESDDLDDLLEVCALLADDEGLEVRECLPGPTQDDAGAGS